ncbi:MAG: hypothetical protein HYR56_11870 [Acidobacteria bacterium]|nr:hypothetical protein [Acidobacteriota bacterium]MBI3428079.1 hypothetical protein [Acidobacteriota bacterium]
MPNPKQSSGPRSSEDILREMEEMADSVGAVSDAPAAGKSGGGFKSLLDFFIKIEPDAAAPSAAPARPMAMPMTPGANAPHTGGRVADLVAGEPKPKFKAPAAGGNLAEQPLEAIYRDAGLGDSPCSVDELAKLLENPALANQPLNVKVIAVNLALSAKGVSHEVPIADAVRRDRALDAFQAMLDERARATEQRNSAQVRQIAQEVEEFLKRKQAEMDALRTEISEVKRQALEFSVRRETEEQRLANLISPFLEGQTNPVTIGNAPMANPPAPKPADAKSTQPLPGGRPTK